MYKNRMKIELDSRSENESFARVAVAAFAAQLDPTVDELNDIKTAVSEAVTNAVIHGYENNEGIIYIETQILNNEITISIEDHGKGIENIQEAMQPLYTSRPDLERSGLGFTVMETFMDSIKVESSKDNGTRVILKKLFQSIQ